MANVSQFLLPFWAVFVLVGLFGPTNRASAQCPNQLDRGSDLVQRAIADVTKRETTRVIGGEVVLYSQHSWQVAIVLRCNKDNFYALFCGGVYIGDSWVITAAHCTDNGLLPTDLQVLWGNERLDSGVRVDV